MELCIILATIAVFHQAQSYNYLSKKVLRIKSFRSHPCCKATKITPKYTFHIRKCSFVVKIIGYSYIKKIFPEVLNFLCSTMYCVTLPHPGVKYLNHLTISCNVHIHILYSNMDFHEKPASIWLSVHDNIVLAHKYSECRELIRFPQPFKRSAWLYNYIW